MDSSGDNNAAASVTHEPTNQTSHSRRGSATKDKHQDIHRQRSISPSQGLLAVARMTPLPLPTSTTASPIPSSREGSPTRTLPTTKAANSSATRLNRSRKNSRSRGDASPLRGPNALTSTVPSAAAIQRALSATRTPSLSSPVAQEFGTDAPKPQRPGRGPSGSAPLPGVTPLRLKSPPPSLPSHKTSMRSPRKFDFPPPTPSIVVDQATPKSASTFGDLAEEEEEEEEEEKERMLRSGLRTPVRRSNESNTLETVDEGSLPTTPATGTGTTQNGGRRGVDRPSTIEESPVEEMALRTMRPMAESGNESAGSKSGSRKSEGNIQQKQHVVQPLVKVPVVSARKSFTQLNSSRAKVAGEGTVQSMTVETETVSSVPQVAAVGGGNSEWGPARADNAGTVRLKPSSETIRPKKEKKKTARKTPSIHSGTGGSSRRFHHHHIHSRAPSPEYKSPDSATSPDLLFNSTSEHLHYSSDGLPVPRKTVQIGRAATNGSSHPLSPKARHSSIVLTNFRGRTASSKADIFEAKVASAVDEANSSDSEETFVYESNPPEPPSHRPSRYHSRTPSATSMASQVDHYGGRLRSDGHHSIAGKKSMKFASNSNHFNGETGENGPSAGTAGNGRGGNGSHHHHIGRYGRGAAHTSLFDNESPFPNAGKPLRSGKSHGSLLSPRPLTPRSPHVMRIPGSAKSHGLASYDLEGEGADDERTPLVGSIRSGRNRNSRRPALRHDQYDMYERRSLCKRITNFLCIGGIAGLLIAMIVVALILCSQPLRDVQIKDIENVVATEQEIMLDLHVHAMNANLVAIQVSELDINIFAKSKYVGTGELWRDDPTLPSVGTEGYPRPVYRTTDGVDEGNDPIPDPDADAQTMLLGQVLNFDSPLIFDASPFRHNSLSSIGEIRLAKPGNQTEDGGSTRWSKVIQHPFELIVKGVMHYSLPISSKVRSVNIAGSITVRPDSPDIGDISTTVTAIPTATSTAVPTASVTNGARRTFTA